MAPPLYRHHPNWYQRNLTQIATTFSSVFSTDARPNFHLLPSFSSQDLLPDGVFLTPVSGLHYVLHIFDSAESVLASSVLGNEAQLSLVRESVRQLDDRTVYLENRHNRLVDVTNMRAAFDAEFNDFVMNRSEEDWFTISGLNRLTQIAHSEWQDAVRRQVASVVKIILNVNKVRLDFEVVHVVNPFRHQTTGPVTYNVRMNSASASKCVRDLFSGFFRHNRPVKLPAELKGLSIRNKVTKETKIRIEILRQLGEIYQASNPGSSYRVRGFESRPLLVTFPPQNSSTRQRTYTFIPAASTLGCRFSDEHLAQIYRVIGNSCQGLLRTLFIVLNDDDRDRCMELAKNSSRPRSRQGGQSQSAQSTSGRVTFAQSSSGTVHGSGAGMDLGTSRVSLEPGLLSSLRSPPPPPPPSSRRSESLESVRHDAKSARDKRRRESSTSSVEKHHSSKSKSKSSKRSRRRTPSTSGSASSGSSRSRSPSPKKKSKSKKNKNKDRVRDRSSSRSRSPSPKGSKVYDRDRGRARGRSKDRDSDAASKRSK